MIKRWNIFAKEIKNNSQSGSEEQEERYKQLKKDITALQTDFRQFKEKSLLFTQKVGIIRFNPFKGQGGDQSFSIAILNGLGGGVVITSIYGRKENHIFAKPVKNGQSPYPLAEEEKEAIKIAEENASCEQENIKKPAPKLKIKIARRKKG